MAHDSESGQRLSRHNGGRKSLPATYADRGSADELDRKYGAELLGRVLSIMGVILALPVALGDVLLLLPV